MPIARFHLVSTRAAPDVLAILTDFSPARPDAWPTIDAEHFEVPALGENWAEVTEATASAWEHARDEWDANRSIVEITTLVSNFGPGEGWLFRPPAVEGGTRTDVEVTRTPRSPEARMLALLLPVAAPGPLRTGFSAPLHLTR